ncbi:hypothetical protein VNO80_16475 [Phaseolus coccineus]|uniref:Uncharacterized protein n=1 Tax=Phaseolus coccineus TaxID=3886 RepID=A0AAN9MMJ3_PHACN
MFCNSGKLVSRPFCCILNPCQKFLIQLNKKLLCVFVFEVSIHWSTLPVCSIFPSSCSISLHLLFFLLQINLLNPQCDNETLKPKGLEEELYVIGHFSLKFLLAKQENGASRSVKSYQPVKSCHGNSKGKRPNATSIVIRL